jgi:cation diffusion facilitator CzcD-associated flavoprotein CzcO
MLLMQNETEPHSDVAIIGAGFSGLGMAMALKQDGIDDFVVLDRAADVGGTWRDNSYPGCACDIPSVLYSWSDEQNPEWSRLFAPQPEILGYMKAVVARHDIDSHLRFGTDVQSAEWEDGRWRIETSQGTTLTADVVVSGAGALADPKIPDLPGLDRFKGTVFHSSRWNHEHDLTDKNVAVVGTGASAIQFVPRIQPDVKRLHLFQRTPPWVLPRAEPEIPKRWRRALARHPRLMHATRFAIFSLLETFHFAFRHPALMRLTTERRAVRHIQKQVADPELRAKLIPDYRMGCKRVLGSDRWYPAISASNVDVIAGGVNHVTEHGIVDELGVEHEVDTIIFGTGFEATNPPIARRIRGRDGNTLAATWQGSPKAHLGVAANGFPNLFFLLGPNTGLGHNSVLLMVEAQTAYVRQALAYRRRHGLATIEPDPAAQASFLAEVDEGTKGSVWTAGGCASWYLDSTGRNSTLWPWSVRAYRRRLARFNPSEHHITQPRPARVLTQV